MPFLSPSNYLTCWRRIFAEGAFSQAFVPILAEYKSKQGEDATRVFVSYVSGC
ncbi:putative virulence factor [Klebsiella pneumoniae]|uniref:Putative virulence factor n=1 Tax=Klebsiella pneumoniae TaxID=573 RepID=A0A4P0XXZ5_KLEPN|nr:putative virulence factor [Klebsiella pneumoniae]